MTFAYRGQESPSLPRASAPSSWSCSAQYFSCGHKHSALDFEGNLEFHASLGYKAESQGKGKPYLEGRTGDDLHRKTGKWMVLERIIDRAKNWYKELITDPNTGRVVRHCEEPLTDHRDHGSAKKKSEPKKAMANTTLLSEEVSQGKATWAE